MLRHWKSTSVKYVEERPARDSPHCEVPVRAMYPQDLVWMGRGMRCWRMRTLDGYVELRCGSGEVL